MPTNKKPRKKYKPRARFVDPVAYVIEGTRPIVPSGRTALAIIHHSALKAMVDGTADHDDWVTVCRMLNVSKALATMGLGEDYLDEIDDAIRAHAKCGARLYKHGRMGYNGQELQAVNLAAELHEEQLNVATVRDIEEAHRRIRVAELNRDYLTSVRLELAA